MLSRPYRLRRRNDFARVHKRGSVVHARTFVLKHDRNRLDHPRLAVVVSTKVSKKAVVRNRLRRRFYSQLRELLPRIKPGVDIIIMVRHHATDIDSQTITHELDKALSRANLLT